MARFESAHPDAEVLGEIQELTSRITDERTQGILQSILDAVALNPQPLPPKTRELLQAFIDAVALNPQPLPPEEVEQRA